jgi:RPA family protein
MTDTTLPRLAPKTERHVSRKVWIQELLGGEMQAGEGVEPNTLITSRGNVNRVSIIGVIIQKEELPVSSITIDDSTGQITVRSFDRKIPYGIGTVVHTIGRPRVYQGNVYITAEAVTKVDPQWAEYRKLELGNVLHSTQPQKEEVAVTEPKVESKVERVLELITKLDDGAGADIDQVILMSKLPEAEQIIEQLLLHGDIFELRPGKVKVL